jgi:hypothetical protein
MRKFLRAAGRTARVFLWIVKGLLLILAVGVLVLWPMSRGKEFNAVHDKYTVLPERVDRVVASIGFRNGQIIARNGTTHYLDRLVLKVAQVMAAQHREGWGWSTSSREYPYLSDAHSDGWGPLRWQFETVGNPDYGGQFRTIAVSCWLLAPLLALWPLTSLILLIRRRTRRRCRLAMGCCLSCGYDLRATPSPGGETLARCPECGAEDQTPQSRAARARAEDR